MKKLASFVLALLTLCLTAHADRGTPEFVTEITSARTVVIRCAGDFVIHDNLLASAKKAGGGEYDFSGMLSEVGPWLASADFTFTNVDGVMGTDEFAKRYGYTGYPSFSTPNSLIYNLKDAGVDLLTLANNHALDYWYNGLISTVTAAEEAGMPTVGGYRTYTEKITPRIITINDIRFGFLNYTDNLNQMDKRSALDKEALEYGVDFLERANVRADVKRLKDAGAEVIVCYMHWGIEYRTTPCKSQLSNAQMLADAGVDVIIGGGPHMVQKAEYVYTKDENGQSKRVLCLYSLGNFLTDQRAVHRDAGIIFDFTVSRDEDGKITISNPTYRTTWVWKRQSGSTFKYTVVFSSGDASRPSGMSDKDYKRMRESAQQTVERMSEGCAVYAGAPDTSEPMVIVPGRGK
ncbi:MAG: CapA family protein [Clostridia bacterium]|nr:CapA family protein [Clostridia bacterium]